MYVNETSEKERRHGLCNVQIDNTFKRNTIYLVQGEDMNTIRRRWQLKKTGREWQKENTRKGENKCLENVFFTDVHRCILCSYLLH